jgi:hypothetical protein
LPGDQVEHRRGHKRVVEHDMDGLGDTLGIPSTLRSPPKASVALRLLDDPRKLILPLDTVPRPGITLVLIMACWPARRLAPKRLCPRAPQRRAGTNGLARKGALPRRVNRPWAELPHTP